MIIGDGPSTKRSRTGCQSVLQNPLYCSSMTLDVCIEIIATYLRHGWELKRVLITPRTRTELKDEAAGIFDQVTLIEAEFDALWFARPSAAGREAWELRLAAEQPYALFEAFEADESEEDREEARLEMEHQMREQVSASEPRPVGVTSS